MLVIDFFLFFFLILVTNIIQDRIVGFFIQQCRMNFSIVFHCKLLWLYWWILLLSYLDCSSFRGNPSLAFHQSLTLNAMQQQLDRAIDLSMSICEILFLSHYCLFSWTLKKPRLNSTQKMEDVIRYNTLVQVTLLYLQEI